MTILLERSCRVTSVITSSYFYSPRSHGKQEFYPKLLAFRLLSVFFLAAEPDVNRYLTEI